MTRNIHLVVSLAKLTFGSALFFLLSAALKVPTAPTRSQYLPPPSAIKNFAIGLHYQWADLLWLRALQDFDYCEEKLNETECKGRSWLFQILNLATELDPKFDPTMYQTSGLALTVIISDYEGASVIFDRAVQNHPNDWHVLYAAAYHAMYEEKNNLKAAKLYEASGKYGAPQWVFSLAGKLALNGGAKEYGQQILKSMIESKMDPLIIKRLTQRLEEHEKNNL